MRKLKGAKRARRFVWAIIWRSFVRCRRAIAANGVCKNECTILSHMRESTGVAARQDAGCYRSLTLFALDAGGNI